MTENLPAIKPTHSLRPTSLDDAAKIARAMAASGMFGFKSPEQALSIMLLADAEGLHPAAAARDYHVIEGRPTLKADAMLARFQGAGGKVEWHERNERIVRATFTHEAGGALEVTWTIERAQNIKGKGGKPITGKLVWQNYPTAMLSARCISEGVRAVFPGCISGMYAPEEFDGNAMEVEVREPQLQVEDNEPAVTQEKPTSEIDKWIQQIGQLANAASIDAWAKRHMKRIAEKPKAQRDKVQKAIRDQRDAVAEAPPQGDPEVVEAEFTEQGPISDSGDVPPEVGLEEPEEEAAPDTAVGRFSAAMKDKIKKAPTVAKLDAMWDRHKPKLDRVKSGNRDAWKELYELKTERAKVLAEFEQEAMIDG
jgi:hypothetical protein